MEVDDLIAASISDENEHGPVAGDHPVLDQRANTRIDLLAYDRHPRRRWGSARTGRERGGRGVIVRDVEGGMMIAHLCVDKFLNVQAEFLHHL